MRVFKTALTVLGINVGNRGFGEGRIDGQGHRRRRRFSGVL